MRNPREYMRRCYALRLRGLSHEHTTALWYAGDLNLLERLESASSDDLRALGNQGGRR